MNASGGGTFVHYEQVHGSLPAVLLRVSIEDLFKRCVEEVAVLQWTRSLLPLKQALLRAYGTPPAVRPQSLMRKSPYSYKQLQRAWMSVMGTSSTLSRTEFLQAVTFLRIVELSLANPG